MKHPIDSIDKDSFSNILTMLDKKSILNCSLINQSINSHTQTIELWDDLIKRDIRYQETKNLVHKDVKLTKFLYFKMCKKDINIEIEKIIPAVIFQRIILTDEDIFTFDYIKEIRVTFSKTAFISMQELEQCILLLQYNHKDITLEIEHIKLTLNMLLTPNKLFIDLDLSAKLALYFAFCGRNDLQMLQENRAQEIATFNNVDGKHAKELFNESSKLILTTIGILSIAAQQGLWCVLKTILEAHPELINLDLSNYFGGSLLNIACSNLHLDLAKFLLKNDAKLNRNIGICMTSPFWGGWKFDTEYIGPLPIECALNTIIRNVYFDRKNECKKIIDLGKELIQLLLKNGANPEIICSSVEYYGECSPLDRILEGNYYQYAEVQPVFNLIRDLKPEYKKKFSLAVFKQDLKEELAEIKQRSSMRLK